MGLAMLSIYFRFLKLNKMQLLTLVREIADAEEIKSKDSHSFAVMIPLCEANLDDITMFFVRQQISIDDCDLHLVKPAEASSALCAPMILNKMLKHIDCKVSV
ncbi:hypothetical protein PALB_9080 [Pseudoalteromonas luteoviolacea B = ATCC 29581]|nr:hypothetical protein PALB_9080 [Pseudoalteromonas luteoviolacea B = ATCC 29581]